MKLFPSEVPRDPKSLTAYLASLIQQIAAVLRKPTVEYIDMEVHYAPPAKVRPGRLIIADGTSWNPGSGGGLYRYEDGTGWVKIG